MRILIVLLLLPALGTVVLAQDLAPDVRAEFVRRTGIPSAALGEVQTATVTLEALGVTVVRAKAVRIDTGETVGATWDAGGRAWDWDRLRAEEVRVRRMLPLAKIDRRLAAALDSAPGDIVRAGAWLAMDGDTVDRHAALLRQGIDDSTPSAAVREMEQQLDAFAAARIREAEAPFTARLAGLGIVPRYVSSGAPAVFFDATAAQVHEIAAFPEVDTLYLDAIEGADTNENAKATHRTDRVHQLGVKGRGIRIAMLEDNGVDPANPWLNIQGWYRVPVDPDDHIHGTSGNVASTHASRGGSAPDANVWSANAVSYTTSDVIAAGDWALAGGAPGAGGGASANADIVNNSWGPTSPTGNLTMTDRYFDYRVRSGLDSVVGSAGNNDLGALCGQVGWNTITVGSHTDGEDGGNWTGDVMSAFSSTGNPSTGCEKPNVAANGQNVATLGDASGYGGAGAWLADGYDGTSFSAPFTTANLANAMVRGGGTISSWPTAAMAVTMVSAWHNIQGARALSDQDGAGGINGLAAFRVADQGHILNQVLLPGSFITCTGFFHRNIHLLAGDRTRICIAWLANANATYTTSTLDADLDLAIFQGADTCSGTVVASSSSISNNFEIVEFIPAVTGWYTVRINDWSFAGTSEDVSIAWSQAGRDSASFQLREFSTETGTLAGPTLGATYYMDIDAPHSPGNGIICAPGYDGGPGIPFPGGTLVPISEDLWFLLWFYSINGLVPPGLNFWSGSVGFTNTSGYYYSNMMMIPALPGLEGTRISHVGVSLEPGIGYPDDIKEISDVHTFKCWPVGTDYAAQADDGWLTQPLPFAFPFFGVMYSEVFINSNGNLTFGVGDADYTESGAEMLAGQPRIAVLWDDLHPGQSGGIVRVRPVLLGESELVVEYINVPQLNANDDNTARVILRPDGSIILQYRDVDLTDCLVGVSPGGGLSAAAEVDLGSSGFRSSTGALYEIYTGVAGDAFDLSNATSYWYSTLRIEPTNAAATAYRLRVDIDPR